MLFAGIYAFSSKMGAHPTSIVIRDTETRECSKQSNETTKKPIDVIFVFICVIVGAVLFCHHFSFHSVRFGSIRIINYFILFSISIRLSIFLNLSPSHFMAHHSNELCYCCYFIRFVNFIYAKHFHWLDKCLA